MSHQRNIAVAQKLLEGIGSGQEPSEIAALFDAGLLFEIQGDDGVLPWIGRKTGQQAVADFIRDIRTLTEPVAFATGAVLGGFCTLRFGDQTSFIMTGMVGLATLLMWRTPDPIPSSRNHAE
jgi:hypothetical protein